MFEGNLADEILSSKDIKLIIKAINDSKQQYQHWNYERNLGFENGKYLDRWNYIFANIRDFFPNKPFKTYAITRGPLWQFAVLYNSNTNILYMILKEDRFEEIKNHKDNPYHYVRVLNSKNCYLQSEIEEQLNMFSEFPNMSDQNIDEDLERMIGEIKNEVKGCVNILFKENKDGVCKISGNVANYDLKILKTYNWNKYISADIEEIIDTKNNHVTVLPKIELNIRKDKIENKNEEIVDDKSNQKGEKKNKK